MPSQDSQLSPSRRSPVMAHAFRVGQLVALAQTSRDPETYEVVQLMPETPSGEPQYRIKGLSSGIVRAVPPDGPTPALISALTSASSGPLVDLWFRTSFSPPSTSGLAERTRLQESVGEVQGRLAAAREDQSRSVRARDQARADLATAQQQLAALTKVPRTDQRAGRAGSALLAASILFCPAGTAGSRRALCPPHESWAVWPMQEPTEERREIYPDPRRCPRGRPRQHRSEPRSRS